MSPGPLLTQLRQHTRGIHDALEQTHYSRALMGGQLPLLWLQRFLQGEARLLANTLAAQQNSPTAALRSLETGLEQRLQRTHFDLEGLAPPRLPSTLERLLQERLGLLEDSTQRAPWSTLGLIYVIAGSALGGIQIAQALRQAQPAQRAWMTRFEEPEQVARRWRALCARMEALATEPEQQKQASQGAQLGFESYQIWMEALADPALEQARGHCKP